MTRVGSMVVASLQAALLHDAAARRQTRREQLRARQAAKRCTARASLQPNQSDPGGSLTHAGRVQRPVNALPDDVAPRRPRLRGCGAAVRGDSANETSIVAVENV